MGSILVFNIFDTLIRFPYSFRLLLLMCYTIILSYCIHYILSCCREKVGACRWDFWHQHTPVTLVQWYHTVCAQTHTKKLLNNSLWNLMKSLRHPPGPKMPQLPEESLWMECGWHEWLEQCLGGIYGSKGIQIKTRTEDSPRGRCSVAMISVVHFICPWI